MAAPVVTLAFTVFASTRGLAFVLGLLTATGAAELVEVEVSPYDDDNCSAVINMAACVGAV